MKYRRVSCSIHTLERMVSLSSQTVSIVIMLLLVCDLLWLLILVESDGGRMYRIGICETTLYVNMIVGINTYSLT